MRYNTGLLVGNGSAQNIELGFVPDFVEVHNVSSTTFIHRAMVREALLFDSGGTEPIVAGDRIDASDGGWNGIVDQVVLTGGTWSGGNAAGWIIFQPGTLTGAGNIANNDTIYSSKQADVRGPATNRADVSAAGLAHFTSILTGSSGAVTVSSAAGTEIVPYYGSEGENSRGFTIGSTISVDNAPLIYNAWARDPGSGNIDIYAG